MDLSKMRARTKMRKIAGQDVPRQNRTSKAFAKAESEAKNAPYAGESGIDVEGNKPRPRLDRPARASGGRVCRAEGGPTLSEDSKAKAKELRDTETGNPVGSALGLGVGGGTYLAHKDKYLPPRVQKIGKALGAAMMGTGAALFPRGGDRDEADRIERGRAEPGKEDRKRGGRVARDKDCD